MTADKPAATTLTARPPEISAWDSTSADQAPVRAHHVYNFGGLQRFTASSKATLGPGRHTIRYEFVPDQGPPGSGGLSRLFVDGQAAGEVRVLRTMPFALSGDEGADVGTDNETPVTEAYREGNNRFTGRIEKVTIETKPPNRT